MKKSFYSLLVAALFSVGVVAVQAAESASEAIVVKLKGSVQATLPGQTQPVDLKEGDKLPAGATIVTGVDSEVDVQVLNGAVATVKADSSIALEKLSITTENGKITKQSSLINLRSGVVVSNIDPSKKAINDYGIRTPKGVAAARGTVYIVSVSKTGAVQTFVARGAVSFINPVTGQTVNVPAGFAVSVAADGTIGEPAKATPAQLQQAADYLKDEAKGGDKDPGPDQVIPVIDPVIISGSSSQT